MSNESTMQARGDEMSNAEAERLDACTKKQAPWKKWGPYLSERQWGTVREDYSESGNAWESFPHDHARSRAYRWGEDGLAGISDDKQELCFALALWNGKDPIIKERLFGLTNAEGNHGEDVKEYYFYLDNTPTHSYMKYLYKYPQSAFPYDEIVAGNRFKTRKDFEYELIDTGIFNEDRYFDVFVEYAKAAEEDILIRITVHNRGCDAASIHVLPTLWYRNTWSVANTARPVISALPNIGSVSVVEAISAALGSRYLFADASGPLLFTNNETNLQRIVGLPNEVPFVKDGINNYLTQDRSDLVNPAQTGTKVSPHYQLSIPAGESRTVRLRLTHSSPQVVSATSLLGSEFDSLVERRVMEANEFYDSITPPAISDDERRIMRQALAGMLWSKQYYCFDGVTWLKEHGYNPLQYHGRMVRNKEWFHMMNDDIISMPDKWEYPWYAAWDLAFHTVALSAVDLEFAKEQLCLMLSNKYLHPNGQIPAYEWNFNDVNPPVHAWAAIFLYNSEKQLNGEGDVGFLKRVFARLMTNFTWWVNRKDRFGKNVFEGGFLGLDNISLFDRSAPLPTGGHLEQADGTAWMALFCQNMMEIAAELAAYDSDYEEQVVKFGEHFVWIAFALHKQGDTGLWDEEDGFYYDVVRLPTGQSIPLKVRSMVGLLPICAATVIEPYQRQQIPNALRTIGKRMSQVPEILDVIHKTGQGHFGAGERGIIALVGEERLRRILHKMLDPDEFLSPHGIRSLSRYHCENPFTKVVNDQEYSVAYLPAESNSGLFGGNSNWRGPIWFPMNILIVRALLQYYLYYGDDFKVECPTGSGNWMTLFQVSNEIARRLTSIFVQSDGRRPVYGDTAKFQNDPHWRDYILFYEYFHGDNGAGLGASHQTGWTGCVARLIQLFARLQPDEFLAGGKHSAFHRGEKAPAR
jgi:hypothetical protein